MKKLVYILLAMLALQGCATHEVVRTEVVEVPKIEHHYQSVHSKDTVFQRDSIHVIEKGDTLVEHHYHHYYHHTVDHDTVHHHDTLTAVVPVEVEKVKYVEKNLTAWQQTRIHLSNLVLIIMGSLLAVRLIIWWLKRKGRL